MINHDRMAFAENFVKLYSVFQKIYRLFDM